MQDIGLARKMQTHIRDFVLRWTWPVSFSTTMFVMVAVKVYLSILATRSWTHSLIDLHGPTIATGQVLSYLPL